jgi:hypothetical protein
MRDKEELIDAKTRELLNREFNLTDLEIAKLPKEEREQYIKDLLQYQAATKEVTFKNLFIKSYKADKKRRYDSLSWLWKYPVMFLLNFYFDIANLQILLLAMGVCFLQDFLRYCKKANERQVEKEKQNAK